MRETFPAGKKKKEGKLAVGIDELRGSRREKSSLGPIEKRKAGGQTKVSHQPLDGKRRKGGKGKTKLAHRP